MEKKFPARSRVVQNLAGSVPEAAAAELEDVVKMVPSLKNGIGPGPTGLRAQFIKELIGEDGADPCAEAVFRVVIMFVEGKVPNDLRCWYGGGNPCRNWERRCTIG